MLPPEQIADWLRLIHLRGVGDAKKGRLLARFGTPWAVFSAPRGQLLEALEGDALSVDRVRARPDPDMEAEIRKDLCRMDRFRIRFIPLGDADYPPLLTEIPDPPLALYVRGRAELLARPQLAVVGSRNPSPGGRRTAYDFARSLASAGLVVTSGLALGVDARAHQGALDAPGGATVAVVATGLDTIYPRGNRRLGERILEEGAMVSEFPTATPPRRQFFPRRNRIISGLAVGTLVVEAGTRSGSLITARMAGEQGREVYAVPGSIYQPTSRGCHRLIREGAKLVENTGDILEDLGGFAAGPHLVHAGGGKPRPVPQLDGPEAAVYALLDDSPAPVDSLIEQSGLTADAVSSILLQLELLGLAETAPGGGYLRTL